jgi:hypothetical protein
MTPAEILATTILAAAALYATYRLVMWLADRAIAAIGELTRHET